MTPDTPIYCKKGEELERKISHLIGRYKDKEHSRG